MAKIIIKWKPQLCGCACKFDVYITNTYIGTLGCGGTVEATVGTGSHMLSFKQKSMFGKKMNVSFVAVVNDDAEIVKLKTRFVLNGNFAVDYADNAPHIPINYANRDGKMNEINENLTDIKREAKKTNGCLTGCLTFIVIIFLIGIISSAIIRDRTITDVKTSVKQTVEGDKQEVGNDADDGKVLYSDDNFKITFVNLADPKTGLTMYNMNLKLENNSDKNVSIYLSEAYVNDIAIKFLGGNADFEGVAPGKKSICAFMFGYDNHDINDIKDVKKLEFKVNLRNSEKFSEVLLSTDTITLNFD